MLKCKGKYTVTNQKMIFLKAFFKFLIFKKVKPFKVEVWLPWCLSLVFFFFFNPAGNSKETTSFRRHIFRLQQSTLRCKLGMAFAVHCSNYLNSFLTICTIKKNKLILAFFGQIKCHFDNQNNL